MSSAYSLFALLLLPFQLLANAAQPGLRDAGGNGVFTPVFPEDSAAFQQIQMVREQVCVQVYPGFAVVKGSYWLLNTSEKGVRMKVGYPLNAREGSEIGILLVGFRLDSLAQLRVRIDGQSRPDLRIHPDESIGQWYVWDMAFAPRDTVLVEVFFIVNTNEASVSEGYSRKHPNGFVYLLETGATWRQPIREGWIGLQLMDGLGFSDVDGLWRDSLFGVNKAQKTIAWAFRDLSPTPADNVILTYGKSLQNFDFKAIAANSVALYAAVEAFSNAAPEGWTLTKRNFDDPFEVGGIPWMSVMIVLIVLSPVMLGGAVIFQLSRWARRRRAKSNVDPLR